MSNKIISGCRRVALHCALKFAKKNEIKRRSALSTLQNGFRKVLCVFGFFLLPNLIFHINLKLLTTEIITVRKFVI